ncbi:MAG: hypothetical protein II135_11110 [Clostridia bacterium]|nr:hypothetical protein [Clostridia bacterium]
MGYHCLKNMQNSGNCYKLTGLVYIGFVFVNEPENVWQLKNISDQRIARKKALKILETEAEKEGVFLKFIETENRIRIKKTISGYEDHDYVMRQAVQSFGCDSVKELRSFINNKYGTDQAVFVFMLSKKGRGYASVAQSGYDPGCESVMLFGDDYDSFMHELLHVFGAADYYYPEKVRTAAMRYFPDSVMMTGRSFVIDDLTKFLIGWHSKPSPEAQALLDATAGITEAEISEALKREWKSGYKEIHYNGSVYYGETLNGIANGYGKFVFDSGSVYEGEILNGKYHGQGRLQYSNGAVYRGAFVDGKYCGVGCLIYPNGAIYIGEFVDGKCCGKGHIIYPDRSKYEGEFVDGLCHGKGVLTYADGSYYKGSFAYGKCHGSGTVCYSNGTVRRVVYENGNLVDQ